MNAATSEGGKKSVVTIYMVGKAMDEEQQSVRSCCGYPGLRVQFVPVGKCMPSCFRSQHQLFEPGFEPRKKSL